MNVIQGIMRSKPHSCIFNILPQTRKRDGKKLKCLKVWTQPLPMFPTFKCTEAETQVQFRFQFKGHFSQFPHGVNDFNEHCGTNMSVADIAHCAVTNL